MRQQGTPAGQKLTVGIRPQDLRAADDGPLMLNVDVVEYLGTESQVVGKLAGGDNTRLVATLPGDAHAVQRQGLRLIADAERLHLFDTATGATLRH